jgi:hypothetical protein
MFASATMGRKAMPGSIRFGLLTTSALLALAACGGRAAPGDDVAGGYDRCVPGQQIACACPGGFDSVQVCGLDSTFDACQCGYDSGSGAGGPGSGAGGPGSGAGGPGSGAGGPGSGGAGNGSTLASGTSPLVDVFVADAGIVIVERDAVKLVDRGGQVLQETSWPRDIGAAAFDGEHLVIADAAKLTTLDLAFGEVASGNLQEACVSGVMVSGKRFVCGPENDWDRIYYTYDALSAALLQQSAPYTYNGRPMRRVPGTDEFITVTDDLSPSDFHLYTVSSSGVPSYINESPYHGDFGVNRVYAFDGSPPTHLVTHEGLMLRIHGANCTPDYYSTDDGCFVKDGALGTLSTGEYFLGMDSDAGGQVYAIVGGDFYYSDESMCTDGCSVQHVDVASHTVTSEHAYTLDLGAVIATHHDPVSGAMVLGYRKAGAYYFEDDPYPGWSVSLLGYQ